MVGFLIGSSGGDSSEPAGNETLAAGAVDISPPSDWTRSAGPAQIPGIDFGDDGTTVTPSGGAEKGTLTVGVTDATDSTLLPDSFLKELSSKPKPTDGVRLGDLEAFRYKGLKPKGFSQQLTVYAAPTTEGVATIACAAPAAEASAFLPECEKVSTTIKMKAGKPYPLGTDDDYASDLSDDQLSQLGPGLRRQEDEERQERQQPGERRQLGRRRLCQRGLDAQGRRREPAVRGRQRDLVKALSSAESAYKSLGRAAKADSSSRYNSARKKVKSAESDVSKALDSLRKPPRRVRVAERLFGVAVGAREDDPPVADGEYPGGRRLHLRPALLPARGPAAHDQDRPPPRSRISSGSSRSSSQTSAKLGKYSRMPVYAVGLALNELGRERRHVGVRVVGVEDGLDVAAVDGVEHVANELDVRFALSQPTEATILPIAHGDGRARDPPGSRLAAGRGLRGHPLRPRTGSPRSRSTAPRSAMPSGRRR